MSSEELKACPFCGGDVSFHKDEECPGCHLIECGQCRAFFDFATGADPGNECETVDALRAAIAPMWNTRAKPDTQELYPHDSPLHKAVFMARDSYTGDETFEDGVLGLIAELKDARKAQSEVQRLRDALEEIADPIKFMRARLEDGEQLNGVYAIQMAESGNYLREIAKRALSNITNTESEK